MGTASESKIKRARKPWRCIYCGTPIPRGVDYYDYRPGQRTHVPYCVPCAALRRLPNAPAWSLVCRECDAGDNVPSMLAAWRDGWSEIEFAPAIEQANFLGLCPDCRAASERAKT